MGRGPGVLTSLRDYCQLMFAWGWGSVGRVRCVCVCVRMVSKRSGCFWYLFSQLLSAVLAYSATLGKHRHLPTLHTTFPPQSIPGFHSPLWHQSLSFLPLSCGLTFFQSIFSLPTSLYVSLTGWLISTMYVFSVMNVYVCYCELNHVICECSSFEQYPYLVSYFLF